MKLKYDKTKFEGKYDKRNLTICKCGKHKYPSKKMFVEFLKQYKDVKADVDIWSTQDWTTGKVKIYLELEYQIPKDEEVSKARKSKHAIPPQA